MGEYTTVAATLRPTAKVGIVGFGLSLGCWLLFFALLIIKHQYASQVLVLSLFCPFLIALGAGLGISIGAACHQDRAKTLPVISIALSGMLILLVLILTIAALAKVGGF